MLAGGLLLAGNVGVAVLSTVLQELETLNGQQVTTVTGILTSMYVGLTSIGKGLEDLERAIGGGPVRAAR